MFLTSVYTTQSQTAKWTREISSMQRIPLANVGRRNGSRIKKKKLLIKETLISKGRTIRRDARSARFCRFNWFRYAYFRGNDRSSFFFILIHSYSEEEHSRGVELNWKRWGIVSRNSAMRLGWFKILFISWKVAHFVLSQQGRGSSSFEAVTISQLHHHARWTVRVGGRKLAAWELACRKLTNTQLARAPHFRHLLYSRFSHTTLQGQPYLPLRISSPMMPRESSYPSNRVTIFLSPPGELTTKISKISLPLIKTSNRQSDLDPRDRKQKKKKRKEKNRAGSPRYLWTNVKRRRSR